MAASLNSSTPSFCFSTMLVPGRAPSGKPGAFIAFAPVTVRSLFHRREAVMWLFGCDDPKGNSNADFRKGLQR